MGRLLIRSTLASTDGDYAVPFFLHVDELFLLLFAQLREHPLLMRNQPTVLFTLSFSHVLEYTLALAVDEMFGRLVHLLTARTDLHLAKLLQELLPQFFLLTRQALTHQSQLLHELLV